MRTPDEVAPMQRLHDLGWGTRRISARDGLSSERRFSGIWRRAASSLARVATRPSVLAGPVDWLVGRHDGNADVVRQDLASEPGVGVSLRAARQSRSVADGQGCILITSNPAVGDWGTVLGDQVVATAILDRLLHHSHALTTRGDSYRLREKRRSGLFKATRTGFGRGVTAAEVAGFSVSPLDGFAMSLDS